MEKVIFENFGIRILKRCDKFFIQYDTGEFVSRMREDEVSQEEALKAQISEQNAYEVLLAIERK